MKRTQAGTILFRVLNNWFAAPAGENWNCESCGIFSVSTVYEHKKIKYPNWYLSRGAVVVEEVDLSGGYDDRYDQFRCGVCLRSKDES